MKRAAAWVVGGLLVAVSGCDRPAPETRRSPEAQRTEAAPTARLDAAVSPAVSRDERARLALTQSCAICHSLDLVRSQRLTRAQWDKELKKMSGWGSPLSDEDAAGVLDLLSVEESPDAAPTPEVLVPAAEVLAGIAPDLAGPQAGPGGNVSHGEALYRATCFACHGTRGEGVSALGPALVARPVIYRRRDFTDVVTHGRRRMPAFDRVYEAPALEDLRAFLKTLR